MTVENTSKLHIHKNQPIAVYIGTVIVINDYEKKLLIYLETNFLS